MIPRRAAGTEHLTRIRRYTKGCPKYLAADLRKQIVARLIHRTERYELECSDTVELAIGKLMLLTDGIVLV